MTAHCYYVVYSADGCLTSATVFLDKQCDSIDDLVKIRELIAGSRARVGLKIATLVVVNWCEMYPAKLPTAEDLAKHQTKPLRSIAEIKAKTLTVKRLETAVKRLRKEQIPVVKGVYKSKVKK